MTKFPVIRYFLFLFVLGAIVFLGAFKCRGHKFTKPPFELLPDMDHQSKLKYQVESDFFADGLASRMPVEGTVPMGFAIPSEPGEVIAGMPVYGGGDSYYATGRFGSFWGHGFPEEVTVDEAFVNRGAERYQIYCSVCHGDSGNGQGVASHYGMMTTRNLHLPDQADEDNEQYRTDGQIFNTITNGMGAMGGYGHNIDLDDRWAIVAYLRVLQKQGLDTDLRDQLSRPNYIEEAAKADRAKNADNADHAATEAASAGESEESNAAASE